MTKRDAPRTCFGNGLPPFGSDVRAKLRFRLYCVNPMNLNFSDRINENTTARTLRFRRKRLAHQVAREAPDNNVLAKLRDFCAEELFDGLIGIFYETLLEQTHRAVKLVEFPIDNFIHHVVGLAFDLALINRLFGIDHLRW